jgi:hypothetical protein
LPGKEDGHHPFSAVTITSRLNSNPLAGGLFVSESEEAHFLTVFRHP